MRPRTGALPTRLPLERAGSTAAIFHRLIFLPLIFLPMQRGLSALIFTRWAHFTWGVAPGWYRSDLWPSSKLTSIYVARPVISVP